LTSLVEIIENRARIKLPSHTIPKIELIVKIVTFITQLLKRQDSYASLFSSALDEGIRDAFKEMGNRFDKTNPKQKELNGTHLVLHR